MRSACFTRLRLCHPSSWKPCSLPTRSMPPCSCCRRGRSSTPTTQNATSRLPRPSTSTPQSLVGIVRAATLSMKSPAFLSRSEPTMSCAFSRRSLPDSRASPPANRRGRRLAVGEVEPCAAEHSSERPQDVAYAAYAEAVRSIGEEGGIEVIGSAVVDLAEAHGSHRGDQSLG